MLSFPKNIVYINRHSFLRPAFLGQICNIIFVILWLCDLWY